MAAIDEVKERLDIVEVISGYLPLHKAGRNFKALCPFHTEKTPSFIIFPERQSWHCFGCGVGGDVFAFIMKKEGVDFGGALKLLAQRAGVTLEPRRPPAQDSHDRLYGMNEAAADYYHQLLLTAPAADRARRHLEGRGVSPKSIEDFALGYSLDNREALRQHLEAMGYATSEIVAAGLVIAGEGETYDRFRGRLMFPIRDARGRVIGFGARALDEAMPKYLNSPQTPIFDKGSLLYGLDRARGAIKGRDLAIIVEGYMDVIAAHQHGFTNVVATMGTALSAKQVEALKGLTRNIVLALDPDTAGDGATLRGIEVARQALDRRTTPLPTWLGATSLLAAEVRVMSLPRGRDPDEVIRESSQEWARLVETASPLIDFEIQAVVSRHDLSRPEARAAAAEELMPFIQEMGDEVQRELYLGKLARLLGVGERTLAGMAARRQRTAGERPRRSAPKAPELPTRSPVRDWLEERCLSLLLQHQELREHSAGLRPEHFERSENREVFLAWRASPAGEVDRASLDESLHQHLELLTAQPLPPATEEERRLALAECQRRLEERRLRKLKAEEGLLLSGVEGEPGMSPAVEERALEINRELKQVFSRGEKEKGRME